MPDQPGLRPTGDRVRETLFNWLAPIIPGSRCLDCFAGSGALGFEAVSRGAAEVVMIERSASVARQLRANAALLGAGEVEVVCDDALRWLARSPPRPFDVVFLDPPFAAGLLAEVVVMLQRPGCLAPGAWVYLETDARAPFPPLPSEWVLTRDKRAGRVRYVLASLASAPGTAAQTPPEER